jgi:cell division protein FtsW
MSKKKKTGQQKPDIPLLVFVFLWILLGFLILLGVSLTVSLKFYNNSWHFFIHQMLFGYLPGGLLFVIAYKINLAWLKKICLPVLLATLTFITLALMPKIGILLGGAKRWITLGPITFQPSEFLKLAFIIYLAAWLDKNRKVSKDTFQVFIPFLVILGIICALFIAQPDISTLGTIIAVTLIIYFTAGTPICHTIALLLIGAGGLAILIKSAPYRLGRLLVFLRPDLHPLGIGYQIKQSLIAVGSGGILGAGLGLSVQKAGFLPQPMTDSIFAIFAEEAGFVGTIFFVLLILVFAWRGFKIAKKCSDDFLRLTMIGITSWFVIQSFINIGAIIGILPLTGIPLPFVSYGSSHLIIELIAVGILLNISKKN